MRHKGKLTLGNAYAQVIQNYSASELKPFFDQKIDEKAKIKTDKWSGYKPISAFFGTSDPASAFIVNDRWNMVGTYSLLFFSFILNVFLVLKLLNYRRRKVRMT